MPWLAAETYAEIIATPESISRYYTQIRAALVTKLGPLSSAQCEDHLRLAFCLVVAYDMKPYGTSSAVTLEDCLKATVLDCDNYAALMMNLFYVMRPLSPTKIEVIGWNGGAIGNHAQVIAWTNGSAPILLDPTIGLICFGPTLDALCLGQKFPDAQQCSFFWRQDLEPFNDKVRNALKQGSYRASHLLYYFPSFDKFQRKLGSANWATPQSWRIL